MAVDIPPPSAWHAVIYIIAVYLIVVALVIISWRRHENLLGSIVGPAAWTKVQWLAAPRDIDLLNTVAPVETILVALGRGVNGAFPAAARLANRSESDTTEVVLLKPAKGQPPGPAVIFGPGGEPYRAVLRAFPDTIPLLSNVRILDTTSAGMRNRPEHLGYLGLHPDTSYGGNWVSFEHAQILEVPADGRDRLLLSRVGAVLRDSYRDLKGTIGADKPAFVYAAVRMRETGQFAYVGYPVSPLQANYDPTEQPWFRAEITSPPHKVQTMWHSTYPDPGTQLPVVTCSRAVQDSGGTPIAIVAIDLKTTALQRAVHRGWPYILNLSYLFGLGLLLGAVITASRTVHIFGPLLRAVVLLFTYYATVCLMWLYPRAMPWSPFYPLLDSLLSMAASVAIAMAALRSFGHGELLGPQRTDNLLDGFQGLLERHRAITPLFEGAGVTLILWIVTTLASTIQTYATSGHWILPGSMQSEPTLQDITDVSLGCLALFFFGLRFGGWLRRWNVATWIPGAVMLLFAAYSVQQLLYLQWRDTSWYWWAILITKVVALTIVLIAVYVWTERSNQAQLAISRIQHELFATPSLNLELIAARGREEILFCSRGLAQVLGWPETEYVINAQRLQLVHPRPGRMLLPDMFMPGEHGELIQRIRDALPDVHERRVVREYRIRLRTVQGEPVNVTMSVVVWRQSIDEAGRIVHHSVALVERR